MHDIRYWKYRHGLFDDVLNHGVIKQTKSLDKITAGIERGFRIHGKSWVNLSKSGMDKDVVYSLGIV